MSDNVILTCWLTFNRSGINRMYKNRPALERGEKAIQIRLSVPKSVFVEPDLVAAIELQGEVPPEHRVEVLADVREALDAIPHIFVTVPDVEAPDTGDET